MRNRSLYLVLAWVAGLLLVASPVLAAPMARILRIDPSAAITDGAPVVTVVVDLVQSKRVSAVVADCAMLSGSGQQDCQSERLEKSKALFTPFPYPEKNANFLVTVDGAANPTKFVWKGRWGDSQTMPGVGTAWLILIDASGSMGPRLGDLKSIANAFINSMGPNDIINIMAFDGRQVVKDSKWLTTGRRGEATSFVNTLPTFSGWGRTRPLANIIRAGVADGFSDLGNVGTTVTVPMHQALVVLSDGAAGTDPSSTGPGGLILQQHLTKGRFPEDNSALPKTPLPVISIWFPRTQIEELSQNSQEFMTNLANPEIGGFFTNVRTGQADSGRATRIVNAVRDRFNHMHIVKYRVSCIAPNVQQTFQLVFSNIKPMIGGDATFKDVPVGIDPSTWPLDVNAAYTIERAQKDPVHPSGSFKVYGDFCWGGDTSRAEVYFLPKNQPAPPTIEGGDIETAKRAQQQLIAMNMRGKALEASDTFVEFEAPADEKILLGSGDKMAVRLVVYDNKAKRTSPVDAKNILTLKGGEAPFPFLWIGGGVFGGLILLLLIVAIVRAGGSKRRRGGGAPPPAPVVAGQAYGAPGAPQAHAYPGAAGPVVPMGGPPAGGPAPYAPQPAAPAAPAAPAGNFMYGGGQPQGYGLTGAQPQAQQPPPNPYGAAPAAGGGTRAVLSGTAGTYPIAPGAELLIGRDSARCQVILQEPRVSATHAAVRFDGGQILVRDMGSNNGTLVNGNRIAPNVNTPVPPGSVLRFGPVEFVVRLE